MKTTGQIIDDLVRKELVWYKKVWRFIFRPKSMLSIKDIEKAMTRLTQKTR